MYIHSFEKAVQWQKNGMKTIHNQLNYSMELGMMTVKIEFPKPC